MTNRALRTIIVCLAATALGCGSEEWEHPSPAIDLPEDFSLAGNAEARGRKTFPTRPVEMSISWEFNRGGEVSQIRMTRHPGSTRPEDVWASVNRLRKENQTWTLSGPETRQVAGRPAWDWSAEVPSRQGTLWAVQRTLVVAFPDSTYVATFWGQHPEWHDQAKLDAVLSSFRIPEAPRPLPMHPIIVVSVLLLVGLGVWFKKRPRREPARPLPSREPVHTGQPNPTMPTEPGMDPLVTQR